MKATEIRIFYTISNIIYKSNIRPKTFDEDCMNRITADQAAKEIIKLFKLTKKRDLNEVRS